MGNIHALAHRVTALSMACLSSTALILVSVSGSNCSFTAINAASSESLITPDGSELPSSIEVAYIGVKCDDSDFYNPDDRMWALSQLFFFVSLGLGGVTTILAWALSTCVPPTRSNWKVLSVIASATAVVEIPIFLLFESEPCVSALGIQACSLALGSYFNIASVILWVAVTMFTVCLDPPRWSQERDAWVATKVKSKDGMYVYSTDNDTHTDASMNTAGGTSHDLLQIPPPKHQRQQRQSNGSSPRATNVTDLQASNKSAIFKKMPPQHESQDVGRSSSRLSGVDRKVFADNRAVPVTRTQTYEETETQEALTDIGVRITTSRSHTSLHQQHEQQHKRKNAVRFAGDGNGNEDAHSPPMGIVGPSVTELEGKDYASSQSSSSLYYRKKHKMRKQALIDHDGDISELTQTVADPGVTVTIICPDGSLKETSLKDPITPCILGDDGFDEMEEPSGFRLVENPRRGEMKQKSRTWHQKQQLNDEQRNFDNELQALDEFHQNDPELGWAPSDSDSSCGGNVVSSNDKVERANRMYMKNLGGSSVHTSDLGGGCCNPMKSFENRRAIASDPQGAKDADDILDDLLEADKEIAL